MSISFTKKTWTDNSDAGTAITALELNRLETVCSSLVSAVNTLQTQTSKTVLYNDASGSNGKITLSNSCANYNVLDIYYIDVNSKGDMFTRVVSPNKKTVHLSSIEANDNKEAFFRATEYYIEGTAITPKYYQIFKVSNNTIYTQTTNSNYLKITKVIGCYI